MKPSRVVSSGWSAWAAVLGTSWTCSTEGAAWDLGLGRLLSSTSAAILLRVAGTHALASASTRVPAMTPASPKGWAIHRNLQRCSSWASPRCEGLARSIRPIESSVRREAAIEQSKGMDTAGPDGKVRLPRDEQTANRAAVPSQCASHRSASGRQDAIRQLVSSPRPGA